MTDIDEFFQEVEKRKSENVQNFYWIGAFQNFQDFFGSRKGQSTPPGGVVYFYTRDAFFVTEKENYDGKFYYGESKRD